MNPKQLIALLITILWFTSVSAQDTLINSDIFNINTPKTGTNLDLSAYSNKTIDFTSGNDFSGFSTITWSSDGTTVLILPDRQVFKKDVRFVNAPIVSIWKPEHFGADSSKNSVSDALPFHTLVTQIPNYSHILLSGHYNVDTTIYITKPMTIDGRGKGTIKSSIGGYVKKQKTDKGLWLQSSNINLINTILDSCSVILDGILTNVTISGNTFTNYSQPQRRGILVSERMNNTAFADADVINNLSITNNEFTDFEGDAIRFYCEIHTANISHNWIHNSDFSNTYGANIYYIGVLMNAYDSSTNIDITHNTIEDIKIRNISGSGRGRASGIWTTISGGSISNNVIRNISNYNYDWGFTAIEGNGNNVSIKDNNLYGIHHYTRTGEKSTPAGIISKSKSSGIISGNHIHDNGYLQYGIAINGAFIISNNIISGDTVARAISATAKDGSPVVGYEDTVMIVNNDIILNTASHGGYVFSAINGEIVIDSNRVFKEGGNLFQNYAVSISNNKNMTVKNNEFYLSNCRIAHITSGSVEYINNIIKWSAFNNHSNSTGELIYINADYPTAIGDTLFVLFKGNDIIYNGTMTNAFFKSNRASVRFVDNNVGINANTFNGAFYFIDMRKTEFHNNRITLRSGYKLSSIKDLIYYTAAPDTLMFTGNTVLDFNKNKLSLIRFNVTGTCDFLYMANNYIGGYDYILVLDKPETEVRKFEIHNDVYNIDIGLIKSTGTPLNIIGDYFDQYRKVFVSVASPPNNY